LREDLRDSARRLACQAVHRASRCNGYALFEGLPTKAFTPGFLRGTAGIGFELLRLECPQLPSVLLWH
jgi:lantibiotic modifying enzyme